MIFQLQNLDRTTLHFLPGDCCDCGWWQGHADGWRDADQQAAWARQAEELSGGWGKLALADGQLLGMIQYGPAALFPGVEALPCGPASADAVLMACSIVMDDALVVMRKSLMLTALAELRELGVETVEAFCHQGPSDDEPGHLFEQDFLRDSGFYPARSSGGIRLMRLELGGVERSGSPLRRSRGRLRLLDRIKRPAPAPSPAALCRREPAPVPRAVSRVRA